MNLEQYYELCKEDGYLTGVLLVQLLVVEKKVLTMQDDVTKIDHFLQDRFKVKMNQELNRLAKTFNYKVVI